MTKAGKVTGNIKSWAICKDNNKISLYLKIPHYHNICRQSGQAFQAAYLPLSLNMCIAGGNQAETKLGAVVHNVCVYPFLYKTQILQINSSYFPCQ